MDPETGIPSHSAHIFPILSHLDNEKRRVTLTSYATVKVFLLLKESFSSTFTTEIQN